MPMLIMADSNISLMIFCSILMAIALIPVYPLLLPVIGIPLAPLTTVATAIVSRKEYSRKDNKILLKAFLYSAVNILLWWHLNQRIKGRRFRMKTITIWYSVTYAAWTLEIVLVGMIAVQYANPYRDSISLIVGSFLLCALVWLLSLIRLCLARWDTDLATPDPRSSRPDILPAPVYLMPLVFSNLWLLWLGMNFVAMDYAIQISILLFIVCMAWIIWDWRKNRKAGIKA